LVLVVSNLAQVYVDGKSKGQLVGTHRLVLPAGQHRLRFRTTTGKEKDKEIQIEAGRTTEYFYSPFLE
jgi:hypothetical protein